jgi:Domain of unknown function (DUF397)
MEDTGLTWRKARASDNGGNCVEVAGRDNSVFVRDTKNREAGHLAMDAATWRTFLADAKRGALDMGQLRR